MEAVATSSVTTSDISVILIQKMASQFFLWYINELDGSISLICLIPYFFGNLCKGKFSENRVLENPRKAKLALLCRTGRPEGRK